MTFMPIGEWSVRDAHGRRKYVTADERTRFLAAAEGMPDRTRALCQVLAYTGCRVSEALGLTRQHIDTERGAIVVRTLKRRRTCYRTIPIPPLLIERLLALPCGSDERLFSLHRATAFRQVKGVMKQAGVSGKIASPRGLRDGLGMIAATRAVPITTIQSWLGHSSPTTTAIYCEILGDEEIALARRTW